MTNISAEITQKLIQENKLEVYCSYNNDAACEDKNKKALKPFQSVKGLPDLSKPLSVDNLTLVTDSHPIGEGLGIIIPAGVCFSFDLAFLTTLGYQVNISLPASGELVCKNASFGAAPMLETANYQKGLINTWDDGSVLRSDDPRFVGNSTSGYAVNTFQIKIEATPLKEFMFESRGDDMKVQTTLGTQRISMIIQVLVMDEKYYQSSNITLFSQSPLGD